MRLRRLLLRIVVVALCTTAALAIIALLSGRGEGEWRILATTTAISVAALLAVPAGVLLERGRARLLARASAGLTALAFALTLALIWHDAWSDSLARVWG